MFLAIAVDNLSTAREMTAIEEAAVAERQRHFEQLQALRKKKELKGEEIIDDDAFEDEIDENLADIEEPRDEDEVEREEERKMLQVRTFFIFGPKNFLRRFCHWIVNLRHFELFIMIIIGASSISLAAEDPVNEMAPRNFYLHYADYVFTVVFTVELVLKVINQGLIGHRHAYLRQLWNILDAMVVMGAVTGYVIVAVTGESAGRNLNTIKAFRAIRVLRPLKTINRIPKLKSVFTSTVNSLKNVTNILIVYLLFQFLFSCIGVQLFKGKFFYCTDPSKLTPGDCDGNFVAYDPMTNRPSMEKRLWLQADFHYDNLISAMLTLFTVTTGEGWPLLLRFSIDSTQEGYGGITGYSKEMALFYIAFFIVFPFFFINIFVALIIITFQEQGEQELANMDIDKNQKRCIEFAITARPISRHIPHNTRSFRYLVWKIQDSTIFEYFIMTVICLNTIVLTLKSSNVNSSFTDILPLAQINLVFTFLFGIEAVIKLIALSPKNYYRDPWNCFDFIIVIGSIADIATQFFMNQTQNIINLSFLRLFRAARLIKLLRLGGTVRVLLWTFIQSCKALPWVFLLIGMLFFIYAVNFIKNQYNPR